MFFPALFLLAAALPPSVESFLKQHCLACHNNANKTAGLSLESPESRWPEILDKVRSGEMPPSPMPKPPQEALLAVTRWIETEIETADRNTPPDPGRVTARRLNKMEFDNTIRDLLGVSLRAADDFPNDDSGYGFDNNGDVLSLSPVLLEKYLAAAEQISQIVLPPPAPSKITLARVTSDRAKGDPSPGAMAITHRFPYWAEYDIEGRAAIVRGAGRFFLALFIDGQHVQTTEVFPGDGPNRLNTVRMPVEPGDHRIRAVFVNEKNEPLTFSDPTQLVTDYIEVRGPYPNPALGDSPARRRLLPCREHTAACAEQIVAALLPRAWRRPVSPSEIARVARFITSASSFDRGVQLALQATLVSPHFLFRAERNPAATAPVNGYELASRLSYFLWSSMPDETLTRAAADLHNPTTLRAQVARMLADPKADALIDSFAGQWLQLRNLESAKPDPQKFPDFDDGLRDAMLQETRHFFAHILRADRPVTELLNARYTFVNERLAKHYALPGVTGSRLRRVELPNQQRGGLLAHASILTISSYPTRTSPVIRGKWILENILGAPPPAPPAGVPPLDDSKVGTGLSLRAQLEKHRSNPNCSVCHNKMDPLGFGLENYDAIGVWRDKDGLFPVDAAGTLPNGKRFDSPAALRSLLTEEPAAFVKCLTEKLLTYALGRGVERYDNKTIRQISGKLAAENYRMSALIGAIVESLPFQYRRGGTQ